MDDVERRARDFGHPDRAIHRFALEFDRPRERVPFRFGVPGGQRIFGGDLDDVAVLGVHLDQAAEFLRRLHRAKDRLVVDLQHVLVGHEDLERVDAFALDHRLHLVERLVAAVGDREMEAVVDRGFAGSFLLPGRKGVRERVAPRVQREVDDRRRAAERGGDRAGGEIVGRRRAAKRHVEMRVRVDAAGENVRAARVDHIVSGRVELGAECGDDAPVHEDVGVRHIGRRDDRPAANQCSDDVSPTWP